MNKRSVGIAVGVLLLAAVVWLLGPGRPGGGPGTPAFSQSDGASGSQAAVPVEAVPVERRTIERWVTYHGTLQPRTSVQLALRLGGRVKAVPVEVGTAVQEGDVLLQLETDELEAQLRQAEASVAAAMAHLDQLLVGATAEELRQARAALRQAEVERDSAQQEFERMERLYASGAVSRQAFDAAEARLRAAQSQVEAAAAQLARVQRGATEQSIAAAEAQLHQAEAARDLVRVQLDNATLRAPMAGTVSHRSVEPGEIAGPGTPVLTLADMEELRLVLRVPGRDVVNLRTGAPVQVTVEDLPHLTLEGRVHRIDPVADSRNNLFGVEVRVPNPDGTLRAGLYASARLPVASAPGVLAVPERAVAEWDGQLGVFTVDDGHARFVPLTFGLSDGRWREVSSESGLQESQLVITAGREFVRPGSPVSVRERI